MRNDGTTARDGRHGASWAVLARIPRQFPGSSPGGRGARCPRHA